MPQFYKRKIRASARMGKSCKKCVNRFLLQKVTNLFCAFLYYVCKIQVSSFRSKNKILGYAILLFFWLWKYLNLLWIFKTLYCFKNSIAQAWSIHCIIIIFSFRRMEDTAWFEEKPEDEKLLHLLQMMNSDNPETTQFQALLKLLPVDLVKHFARIEKLPYLRSEL